MRSLNVLVAGDCDNVYELLLNSKYLKKLYTTSSKKQRNCYNIKFNTFRELANKCKALQIDIVIVTNEQWILEGIADVLKSNYINCIAPISHWTNLKTLNDFSASLLSKYNIKFPERLTLPNKFPLLVRSGNIKRKANSIPEIISIQKEIFEISYELSKNVYLEEWIDGEKYTISALFDGKNLLLQRFNTQNKKFKEKLEEYKIALQLLLTKENAQFVGFINSELVWDGNYLYNTGFDFNFSKPVSDIDILALLESAIYQKLNEINSF